MTHCTVATKIFYRYSFSGWHNQVFNQMKKKLISSAPQTNNYVYWELKQIALASEPFSLLCYCEQIWSFSHWA